MLSASAGVVMTRTLSPTCRTLSAAAGRTFSQSPPSQKRLNLGKLFTLNGDVAYSYREWTYSLLFAGAAHAPCIFLLYGNIDTEKVAHQQKRQYTTNDSKRIGNCIGHGNFGGRAAGNVAHRLLRGTESGGVCYGTREHSHHCGYRQSRGKMQRNGEQHSHRDNRHSHHIERKATLAESREESRAHLQAHRIDKEYKAELLHKVQKMLIYIETHVSKKDSHEKNPCNAKGDARNLYLAQHHSEAYHQRENKHRVGHSPAPLSRIALEHIRQKVNHKIPYFIYSGAKLLYSLCTLIAFLKDRFDSSYRKKLTMTPRKHKKAAVPCDTAASWEVLSI